MGLLAQGISKFNERRREKLSHRQAQARQAQAAQAIMSLHLQRTLAIAAVCCGVHAGALPPNGEQAAAAIIAAPPFGFALAFDDGMVLAAAPKQAMVWGFCDPGTASVGVSLDGGAAVSAVIGPDQATGALTTWRAKLPATAAGFSNHSITATSSSGLTVNISSVLFGGVWICSGQSNMEYPIGTSTCWNASNINCTNPGTPQCSYGCTQDAGQTIADMPAYDNGMRLFNVYGASSNTPLPDMRGGTWKTPSAAGGAFSATCWFFGRDIYDALPTKVPVGLMSTYVGGTPVQHWTSPDGLATCEGPNTWDWPPGYTDSVLWNAMVVPLLRTVHSASALTKTRP